MYLRYCPVYVRCPKFRYVIDFFLVKPGVGSNYHNDAERLRAEDLADRLGKPKKICHKKYLFPIRIPNSIGTLVWVAEMVIFLNRSGFSKSE